MDRAHGFAPSCIRGVLFWRVKDEVRRAIVRNYLQHSDPDFSTVPQKLGFSEQCVMTLIWNLPFPYRPLVPDAASRTADLWALVHRCSCELSINEGENRVIERVVRVAGDHVIGIAYVNIVGMRDHLLKLPCAFRRHDSAPAPADQ